MTGILGISLPFDGVTLRDHRPLLRGLVEAGIDDLWTGEVAAPDGFGPLQLFAGWEDSVSISCAAASVYTRGPAVLAMTAATMAETAPGRCRFGIGAGSPVVNTTWNGAAFVRPYQKVSDTLHFLRQVLAGERASDYETVHGAGFKLGRPVAVPPKLMLAVAGPRMQDLAAAEADSMALNFLAASDVAMIRERCARVERNRPDPLELAVRVFVLPDSGEAAEVVARRFLAGYLTVSTYAQFQQWLGRGAELTAMQTAWDSGDRRGATQVIPEQVVRDLVVYGTADQCAERLAAYFDAGVDVLTVSLLPSASPISPSDQVAFIASTARALKQ